MKLLKSLFLYTTTGLIGILYALFLLSAIAIHLWTIIISYAIKGFIAALITFIFPILSEIYWMIYSTKLSGIFLTKYNLVIISYVSIVFVIGIIILIYGFIVSNKNKKKDEYNNRISYGISVGLLSLIEEVFNNITSIWDGELTPSQIFDFQTIVLAYFTSIMDRYLYKKVDDESRKVIFFNVVNALKQYIVGNSGDDIKFENLFNNTFDNYSQNIPIANRNETDLITLLIYDLVCNFYIDIRDESNIDKNINKALELSYYRLEDIAVKYSQMLNGLCERR